MPHLMEVRLMERSGRPCLTKAMHFVAAGFGLDEVGLLFIEVQQLFVEMRRG